MARNSRAQAVALLALAAVVAAVAGAGSGTGSAGAQTPPYKLPSKPNILLIQTDDMRVSDLARMPATRRLIGAAGTTFTRSYVSFPLCCPSRATLNSGQYSRNNGVRGNRPPQGGFRRLADRGNLLAGWLQAAGYHTVHIGKYLNGFGNSEPATPQPGWSDWRGSVDPTTYRMWGYTLLEDGQSVTYGTPAVEDPALYQTDVYRDKAEALIRARATTGQPFYLDLAFLAPHGENNRGRPSGPGAPTVRSAPRHRGRLANARLPRPQAFDERDISDKPRWLRDGAARLRPAQIARITNAYRSRQEALLAVDEAVARLLAVLTETGQLADTYVVFTSDNGFFLGEHRIPNGKTLAYEPSARVPLLIRGPGIPAGGSSRELVANVDLAPTFAAIAGASPRRTLDGRSLLPYATDTRRSSSRSLLLESGPGRSSADLEQDGAHNQPPMPRRNRPPAPSYSGIRVGDLKYIAYADGSRELYDLARDPQELRNRAGDRRYGAAQRKLARRLAGLRRCRGASCRRPFGRVPRLSR